MQLYKYEGKNLSLASLTKEVRKIARLGRIRASLHLVPCGKRVLDIGSGIGIFPYLLSKKSKSVLGVEALTENVAISKNLFQADNLAYYLGNGEKFLRLMIAQDQHYEVITALEVIEHMEAPTLFLKQCHQVLTSDGILVLSTPNALSPTNILLHAIKDVNGIKGSSLKGTQDDHLFSFDKRCLYRLLDHCGFYVVGFTKTKHSLIVKCKKIPKK